MPFVLGTEIPVSTAPDTFRTRLVGTPAEAAAYAAGVRPLTELPIRSVGRVVGLVAPDEPHDPEIIARLGELGFLPGEPVRVIAKAFMGDPIAVRVGTGTFALRRGEARCVHVRIEA